jgi:thiol-disulfide isomerase/thioredoxin
VLTSDNAAPVPSPLAFTPIPITTDHALEGEPAPNFELARLDGEGTIRLSSLRGRMVFVNFWATWCEPCRRELPALQAFSQSEQGSNAPLILAVNIGESPEQITPYFDELGINDLTVLLDSNWSVSDLYQTEVYPSTFVIDPAGTVVDFHLGEITLDDLEGYVAAYGT